MIRSKTCFIVGAGASTEVGLPAGAGLKTNLRNTLDLRLTDEKIQTGSEPIYQALRLHCQRAEANLGIYLSACGMIARGMAQAASIDNFIHAYAGNKVIEICGKIGIAETILRREGNCYLTPREQDGKYGLHQTYQNLAETWYGILFQAIVEDVQKQTMDDIFANVEFVTFNYDRCIEQFFFHAIKDYYNLPPGGAALIARKLKVYHAYGSLGGLPWQEPPDPIEFGHEPEADVLLSASSRLRTFTEGKDDKGLLAGVGDALRNAENVIFLGFAFHRLNMEILSEIPAAKYIMGTSDGLSDYDMKVIQENFQKRYNRHIDLVKVRSASFLSSYRRMFTA